MQYISVTVHQDSPNAKTLIPTRWIQHVMALPAKMGGGSTIKCRFNRSAYRVSETVEEIDMLLQKRRIVD